MVNIILKMIINGYFMSMSVLIVTKCSIITKYNFALEFT